MRRTASRASQNAFMSPSTAAGSLPAVRSVEFECALARQCLNRRIDESTLTPQVAAWEQEAHAAQVDWQFTTADARVKLKCLYPGMQLEDDQL